MSAIKSESATAGIELTHFSAEGGKSSAPSRQVSKTGNRHSLLELHVCLPDLTHVTLMIDQRTQATEIMDMIIEALGLNPAEARHVLSLWLVSSDLELQLKPNHCPTQLFGKWPVYLRKYTTVGEKLAQIQKPQVHLRRNVYISREEDMAVTDVEILELLFTEARSNVINGTYPCSRDLVLDLAGILCAIQYGPYNEQEHTPEFYKANQAALFPVSLLSDTKSLVQQLIQLHAVKMKTFVNSTSEELRLAYLSACSDSLVFYGSVFFDGYIERVNKSFLHSSWLAVSIGANTDGVYIISTEKQEPILGIPYEDLTWEYVDVCSCTTADCPHSQPGLVVGEKRRARVSRKVKSSNKDKVNGMPSLLLQYPATQDEQSDGIGSQVLKVYTMSARLIDAFIDNCSEILKLRIHNSPIPSPEVSLSAAGAATAYGDMVDGPRFGRTPQSTLDPNRETLERSIRSLMKPNKLTCQSFSKDGKCISA